MERIETIVVGAGQAGRATSSYLHQAGQEHLVLERGSTVAPVLSVTPVAGGEFRITTPERAHLSRSVVIATGYEQQPRIPVANARLPADLVQLHSSQYRKPEGLPDGGVLVVGSGQSGAQSAEELHQHGRRTFLATSGAGRVPRRYRGRDIVAWLGQTGFFGITPEKLPAPKNQFVAPHVSGRDGGRTLNVHRFVRDGVTLLGRLQDADGPSVSFAQDLHETLTQGDQFEVGTLRMIDEYVQASGTDAPEEPYLSSGMASRSPPSRAWTYARKGSPPLSERLASTTTTGSCKRPRSRQMASRRRSVE